jgi:lysozyme family protein
MANHLNIIPFIKSAEGGLSKNPQDQAAAYPVPDGSGYHTNKGITWKTWSANFGNTQASIYGFYNMTDANWEYIFKKYYWNAIFGDQINSQKIADILVNWVWMSGSYTPVKNLQYILGITQDGQFGPITLAALNNSNQADTYNKLKGLQTAFINNLGAQPKYSMFLTGWTNRLKNLFAFTDGGTIVKNSLPIIAILAGIALIYFFKNKQ